jgi:hypothetical protein
VPRLAAVALAVLVAASCSGGDGGGGSEGTGAGTTTTEPAAPTAVELCAGAQAAPAPATVVQPALVEASGIATSRRQPGLLWAHNDSGGEPEVFAIGEDGGDRGRWSLPGAEAIDWEDMARGPGEGGADVLYLGDIGDNGAQRADVTVYRAAEPEVPPGAAGGALDGVEALTLTYADGAQDAEALLADPVTGDLFIVTKVLAGPAGVYRIPAGSEPGATTTMEREGDVAGNLVTGGDISPDGSVIGLRTYLSVLLWDRAPDQTVPEALAGQPCTAPAAIERQGEALAMAADGRGYVTVSEGAGPSINVFRVPEG